MADTERNQIMFTKQRGMIQIYLIVALIVGAAGVSGYFYVLSLRSDLKVAEANQIKMQEAQEAQAKKIKKLDDDMKQAAKVRIELFRELSDASKERAELAKTFTQNKLGKKRDFSSIAVRKPGLVENIVNNATRDALRCNEIATGSPLTADERAGKVKNSVCGNMLKVEP